MTTCYKARYIKVNYDIRFFFIFNIRYTFFINYTVSTATVTSSLPFFFVIDYEVKLFLLTNMVLLWIWLTALNGIVSKFYFWY